MAAPVVALATARSLTKEDYDLPPLVAALEAEGARVQVLAWDDPQADFSKADICVIRSTWNYVQNLDAFLAWCQQRSQMGQLWNPAALVQWNSHKSYLFDLERRGIPIVPTRFVPRGSGVDLVAASGDWEEVVIKPAVSAGSFGTLRVGRGAFAAGQEHLRSFAARRDMLVQKFEPSVLGYGERSLVFLGAGLSHAARKGTRFAGDSESITAAEIAPDERAFAEKVLGTVSGPMLYARVDVVRDPSGSLRLMELELIEPSLFFHLAPGSASRFARAIVERAARC